jgi:RNA polymerase sigma-70 factor (ECF subfamily)
MTRDGETIGGMDKDSDKNLIDAVAAGDVAAMKMMVSRKLPRLLALATRMLGDPVEAEDVAQETFLRIWKHAGRWKPGEAKFDTWIYRVALNLCYDRLRKNREDLTAELPDCPDTSTLGVSDFAIADVTGRDVEQALQAIAPRQREAIILIYYQDMSNKEAADVMQITVEALESLLARGRRSLQSKLGRTS